MPDLSMNSIKFGDLSINAPLSHRRRGSSHRDSTNFACRDFQSLWYDSRSSASTAEHTAESFGEKFDVAQELRGSKTSAPSLSVPLPDPERRSFPWVFGSQLPLLIWKASSNSKIMATSSPRPFVSQRIFFTIWRARCAIFAAM